MKDVFNAHETGMFYKLLPNKTLTFGSEYCASDTLRKDCNNCDGMFNKDRSEKLKVLLFLKQLSHVASKELKHCPVIMW